MKPPVVLVGAVSALVTTALEQSVFAGSSLIWLGGGVRRAIDVAFVGGPDPDDPIGVKGVGEIGLVGVAAAIANGVY